MIHRVKQILNYNYGAIVESIKLMETQHPLLYQPAMKKVYGETKYAFQGGLLCGEACYITKYLLEHQGFQVQVWKNKQGYGDYYSDHCFLWLEQEGLIVDPTYKQFLDDDREKSPTSQYHQLIYKTLPPFFIGTKDELDSTINVLNCLNEQLYGTSCLKDISRNWRFSYNISDKFDLLKCVTNRDYLMTKPDYYHQVVKLLKTDNA